MLQTIYIEYLLSTNKNRNKLLENKLRKISAKEYQKMFSGTRVSYMERLFNRVS